MSSATPWYLQPITQSFNGGKEKGVDLGVPYHTPINPLFPGVVTAVDTGPYGQEVNVQGVLNGQTVNAAYVHLDQATVAVGQPVSQSSLLGYSGGQTSGGLHPASTAYSSGPHIEFSLWPSGTTPYVGKPYNPMGFIQAVQSSGGGILPALDTTQSAQALPQSFLAGATGANLLGSLGSLWPTQGGTSAGAVSGASGPIVLQLPSIAGDLTSGIQSGVTGAASGIGRGLLGAFHVNSLVDLLFRAGLLIVALVLIIVIAQALTAKATQNSVELVSQSKPVQTAKNVLPFVK